MNTTDPMQMVETYASAAKEATQQRDDAIVLARANGATFGQIAVAAQMTPQGISRVIERKLRRPESK